MACGWGSTPRLAPDPVALEAGFPDGPGALPARAPIRATIAAWEERHGYRLPAGPAGLAAALQRPLSLGAADPPDLGDRPDDPVRPRARMIVQPESWFELGNPNLQTVCIDLAYRLPGGGHPIFTSGDDASGSPPRIIARELRGVVPRAAAAGRAANTGSTPDFEDFGEPWPSHRRHAPGPRLSDGLRRVADRVPPLIRAGADEREIAVRLGLSRPDVELILRHLQHVGAISPAPEAASS